MNRLAHAIALARSVPKTPPKRPQPPIAPWHPPRVELVASLTPIQRIQIVVANAYGVECIAMLGRRRYPKFALPRQVAIYLASELTGGSLNQIGRAFNRDHTTILHAIQKIDAMCRADVEFESFIRKLKEDLRDDN